MMKKRFWILLMVLMVAGCASPKNAPVSPPPVAESPRPTFAYPDATLTGTEQGAGHKAGTFAASDADSIFYFTYVRTDDQDFSRIYRRNKKTGRTKMIRQTANGCYVCQLFTDEAGDLYYVQMAYDEKLSAHNSILRYHQTADESLVEDIDAGVVRVDSSYLFFRKNDYLCAYGLADGKIVHVVNDEEIQLWDTQSPLNRYAVDCNQTGDDIAFLIKDMVTGETTTTDVSGSGIDLHLSDTAYTVSCFWIPDQNTLLVLVGGDAENGETTVYRIDSVGHTVLSSSKVLGSVLTFASEYGRFMYFYALQETETKNTKQAIYSLDLADGKLKKLLDLEDSDAERTYYRLEAESGLLFVYAVTEGDETPVDTFVTAIRVA